MVHHGTLHRGANKLLFATACTEGQTFAGGDCVSFALAVQGKLQLLQVRDEQIYVPFNLIIASRFFNIIIAPRFFLLPFFNKIKQTLKYRDF